MKGGGSYLISMHDHLLFFLNLHIVTDTALFLRKARTLSVLLTAALSEF